MSKHRRDSINGKMNVIGRFSEWGRKNNAETSFFRPKSLNTVQVPPDELDDIELLESIVLELNDFDWEDFEKQRVKSMFYRKRQVKPNVRRSQFKEMMVDGGAVQCEEVSDDEMSETGSVLSKRNTHRFRSEEFIHQLSKDGKSKLKFIMQFADSGNTTAATTTLRDLLPQDRIKIRNSIHHARLSNLYNNTGKRRSTMMSLKSKGSILGRKTKNSQLNILKNDNLEDKFAKMKGYKSTSHMEKSLERFRGFEELRDETQINLMAAENGYHPGTRTEERPIEDIDFSDSEDEEEEKELEEFMKLDDENLEDLLNCWELESHNTDSEDELKSATAKSKKEAIRCKEMRKQKAIRNGWEHKTPLPAKPFLQHKLQPKDSLTARHLDTFETDE